MKHFRYLSLIFQAVLVFFLASVKTEAQEKVSIQSKWEQYRKSNLQEKLYVHTDKSFYLTGEIIWFSIYDINGAYNGPFSFSKVAYVELLNNNNKPVYQTKVSLEKKGSGSIKIPFSVPSGKYLFRAYTAWMKNFSASYFFKKYITIINTSAKGSGMIPSGTEDYTARFLPEGGNLVAGIKSEVGFKVVHPAREEVKGVLLDDKEDTVLTFTPLKQGIGKFEFTPKLHSSYKAVLRFSNGKKITKELPEVYAEGYVLHAQKEADKVQVSIRTNISDRHKVYLIVQTRGQIKKIDTLDLQKGSTGIKLKEKLLGEGISQLTLFDEDLHPVSERLYFKKVSKKLNISVKTGKENYRKREKISLSLTTKDEAEHPVGADMSVSVYRLDSLQGKENENILNYLWLTSDLKGPVQDPSYYFNNKPEAKEALDNLLLTGKWRRFGWEDVLKGNLPLITYAPENEGLVIAARVLDQSGEPAEGILSYLGVLGRYNRIYGEISNEEGYVFFRPENFYGNQEIALETNTQSKDSMYHLEVRNPFSEKSAKRDTGKNNRKMLSRQQIENHYLWEQVQAAYHGAELGRLQPLINMDSTSFYGQPFNRYLLDNYTRYTTMEEVLREFVTEVSVRKRKGHYHLHMLNNLISHDEGAPAILFQDDPLILLDGIPVFNVDSVMALDPLKVEKLEVIAGRYFWGPIVADGILSFTTYKGDMAGFNLNSKVLIRDFGGLQRQRIFYSPEYDSENPSSSRIPDYRNVLYWNPSVKSDKEGHAALSFYSSDLPGRYVVVINGITEKGRAGSAMATFEVGQMFDSMGKD